MKKLIALLLALTMVFTLGACIEVLPQPTPAPTPVPTPTPEPYDAVTYLNGENEVTVTSMPKKVVTAGPNCTEVMCLLGLADKVIGQCMRNHSEGALESCSALMDGIPELCGGYPTLEAVINSGCDFLYASSWVFSDTFKIEDLQAAGITVYVNDASTYNTLTREIRDIGAIFEVPDKAEEFISLEMTRINSVRSVIIDAMEKAQAKLNKDKGEDEELEKVEPLKVLVLDSFIADLVYTPGSGNIENTFIRSAGGVNILADMEQSWNAVEPVDIYKLDPDVIIIHDYPGSSYDSKVEHLKTDPTLSRMECVRGECFVRLPLEDIMPGSRAAVAVETIAAGLYPDLFK